MPLAKRDRAIVAPAGDANRSAFLLAAAEAIGERVIRADVKKLSGRLVVPRAPRLSPIDGDDGTLVAPEQNDVAIVGVDPNILIIVSAGGAAKTAPGFAVID